jgi:hypothetical protein
MNLSPVCARRVTIYCWVLALAPFLAFAAVSAVGRTVFKIYGAGSVTWFVRTFTPVWKVTILIVLGSALGSVSLPFMVSTWPHTERHKLHRAIAALWLCAAVWAVLIVVAIVTPIE